MVEAIAGLGAAFGLSGSAGLNAYIPLLIVALAARFPLNDPLIKLSAPYDLMGSNWAIGLLIVLVVIEMLVDKIPAVDTLNDLIQTFIRPAAGAILFAASANVITEVHPVLALGAGLLVAGSVHAVKGVARPVVTATTGGTGNWAISIAEDLTAFSLSMMAILLPILAGLVVLVLAILIILFIYRRRKRKQKLLY